MKTLIVYDSFFGNTEQIAKVLSNSFGSNENSIALKVCDVSLKNLKGLDLLIVGSPTRGFRPSKAINSFLKKIPPNFLIGIKVASFDTRISPNDVDSGVYSFLEKIFGYAAEPISRKLTKKGGNLVAQPIGFFVKDSKGPLKTGELDRAVDWAQLILKAD